MCKIFKNYNKVFADHLFISQAVLDSMEKYSEWKLDDMVFEYIDETKTMVEAAPRGKKEAIAIIYRYISLNENNVWVYHDNFVIQREWIGNSVIATVMLEEELPVRAEPYHPTIKDHIFMWKLKRAVKKTMKEAAR